MVYSFVWHLIIAFKKDYSPAHARFYRVEKKDEDIAVMDSGAARPAI